MVSVELPPAVTLVGLNAPLAPDGSPDTARLTVCAEPEVTAVEMVDVPFAPCTRLRLDGLAEIEKSFVTGAVTVKDTEVVWVAELPVPVTTSG
jgi:hypothetical protein